MVTRLTQLILTHFDFAKFKIKIPTNEETQ
jgi:hypothetical protein